MAGVCIHAEQAGVQRGDINLTNDEEEGLSATRSVWVKTEGGSGFNFFWTRTAT